MRTRGRPDAERQRLVVTHLHQGELAAKRQGQQQAEQGKGHHGEHRIEIRGGQRPQIPEAELFQHHLVGEQQEVGEAAEGGGEGNPHQDELGGGWSAPPSGRGRAR